MSYGILLLIKKTPICVLMTNAEKKKKNKDDWRDRKELVI